MLEVTDELHAQSWSTHRGQRESFATDVDVDDTQVIDVDGIPMTEGAR
jgi:hypothetical protein